MALLLLLENERGESTHGPVGKPAYFVLSEQVAYAEPWAIINGNMNQGDRVGAASRKEDSRELKDSALG